MIEFIAVLLLILLGSITINLILYMRLETEKDLKQLWMNQAKAVNKRWIQETCMLPVDNLRLLNGGKDEN